MQLERFEEACGAWRLMEEQADTDHARRTADEMLAWLRPQSEQQRRWRQAEGHGERAAELLAAGDSEAAVAALVDGLQVGPDHGGLKRQLSALLGRGACRTTCNGGPCPTGSSAMNWPLRFRR